MYKRALKGNFINELYGSPDGQMRVLKTSGEESLNGRALEEVFIDELWRLSMNEL